MVPHVSDCIYHRRVPFSFRIENLSRQWVDATFNIGSYNIHKVCFVFITNFNVLGMDVVVL